jgi:crotonobetainyl-CoA:carnitine CoA-transferase CaiB-like acyl-CoA transferase
VLFMASERQFWENFCAGVDRRDLFERWPGERYADHARGNEELRGELERIFAGRTTAQWVAFAGEVNTPICPVNDATSILSDPHFLHRFPWIPAERAGADLMPVPVAVDGEVLPDLPRAPTVGEHTAGILADVLGYRPDEIAELERSGAFGRPA